MENITKGSMMAVAKVSPQYQITIPQAVRETLGIKQGDYMDLDVVEDGSVVMRHKRLADSALLAQLSGGEAGGDGHAHSRNRQPKGRRR